MRASDRVRQDLIPLFGSDLGLPALVRGRPELAAALARGAGRLRVTLGFGPTLRRYNLDLSPGAVGVRAVLSDAPDPDVVGLVGAWAEVSPDGVVLTDADDIVVWCNPSFCSIVGYTQDEILGRRMSVFRSSRVSHRMVNAMTRDLVGTGTWTGQTHYRRSDGTEFPARLSVAALTEPDGRLGYYLGTVADATEQLEQDRLDQLDASTTLLGRLARGFAHDINNLGAELVAATEALQESAAGALAEGALAHLERVGAAYGNLGRQLLALSTRSAEPPPSDLRQVTRDLGWLLHRASTHTREIRVEADGEPLWVEASGDALLRAALGPALRAVIELADDQPLALAAVEGTDRASLQIRYEVDATERERLRALFPEGGLSSRRANHFRARALEAGATLSLALDGSEACIHIDVPLAALDAQGPTRTVADTRTLTGRALVVEDNDALRELVTTALQRDFPATLAAADGLAGLEALERIDGRVDLVLVDLMMPRMKGLAFLREAISRWPQLAVIVMSGAASSEQVREANELGAMAVLSKPFRIRDLRETVTRILGDL